MAAPTGYSVPMAQGTGLGPVVQGYVPTSPASVDPNALPPVLPTAPSFPASTGTAATPKGSGIPPSVVNKNNADLFDEPDIFIPGPKSTTTEIKKDNDNNNNNNNDDDDNTENAGGAGDGTSDSYANLAARFSQLQK